MLNANELPSPCQLSFSTKSGSNVMIANRLRDIQSQFERKSNNGKFTLAIILVGALEHSRDADQETRLYPVAGQ